MVVTTYSSNSTVYRFDKGGKCLPVVPGAVAVTANSDVARIASMSNTAVRLVAYHRRSVQPAVPSAVFIAVLCPTHILIQLISQCGC